MMMYPDIKVALVDLTLLALKIQDDSPCLTKVEFNNSIGVWSVYVSKEYIRRMSDDDNMYEAHIPFGDEYYNDLFEEAYMAVKYELEKIYESVKTEYI